VTQASLCGKFQIKDGRRVVVLGAPRGFGQALRPLPPGASLSTALRGRIDVLLAFFKSRRSLAARGPALRRAFQDGGILWVCYPKLTSKKAGELNREVLWQTLAPAGLQTVGIVALDSTWSALRFKLS
jgi:hypothetical protein